MTKVEVIAKEFKKMSDPNDRDSSHIKYVCYVQANSIPNTFEEWMQTNPREQKMTTNVATKIKESLNENINFHELNRGILISAKDVKWDNSSERLTITFDDPEKHGNIDGGHTLKAILDAKNKNILDSERFVFFEILTGIESPVELAAARNTSVQVDLKSIAELENSFEVIKDVFDTIEFSDRIQYKMNQNDKNNPIDVRELISILIMFSQEIYPIKDTKGVLSETQPIQSYSGKESSLKKFLYLNANEIPKQKINREKMIKQMKPIISDIFKLWEEIECSFATVSANAGKRYGTRKYSKFNGGNPVGKSYFGQKDIYYVVPKGIMYPLVGSFRALVKLDNGKYMWKKNPLDVWNEIGQKLVTIVLDERSENPDALAKNSNLWSNLFKEIYIFGWLTNK